MNRLKMMMAALALTMLSGSARADDKDQHLKTYAASIAAPADNIRVSRRPEVEARLFTASIIEQKIQEVQRLLKDAPYLAWMFGNCFPNTLDTTVHYSVIDGDDDTFVYTGDIHAMWLRDSGAQVWPYVQFAKKDEKIRKMVRGTILRQLKCIVFDPYANAFNFGPTGSEWASDLTDMKPFLHERKYEIDSLCYPIRLAYQYWLVTGDDSIFKTDLWLQAVQAIVKTFREQQRKDGRGPYRFQRTTAVQYDTMSHNGYGNPVKPVGLIASAFRPSDDATVLLFLVPSNFMAVHQLRNAADILSRVNRDTQLADECTALADEVESALRQYAVCDHPKYGQIYAYEVDGFGNHLLMDDANVPSLLAMAYLGDVPASDPIYQNTRRFVWSEDNPYFFRGRAGEGIGGPHVGYDMVWPMSVMMRAFTSTDDAEIQQCIQQLVDTDAGTGFIHESFNKNDATDYTRPWFAWQNTLFGELILKLIDDGKLHVLKKVQKKLDE
ncbi:MAG: glycoside hydrolase family 125 protein [Prevotella sp.]|nr:glycoside hydrolase family 125 protein [Prevotella sp.]